jgi:hypothetical protein
VSNDGPIKLKNFEALKKEYIDNKLVHP